MTGDAGQNTELVLNKDRDRVTHFEEGYGKVEKVMVDAEGLEPPTPSV